MPKKRITVFIANHTYSTVRQFSASRAAVAIFFFFVVACLAGTSNILRNYHALRTTLPDVAALEQQLARQTDEINAQRQQIQKFASDINTLKAKLIHIVDFEKKIREIANLEDSDAPPDSLIGVGGSMPEDLDPTLSMFEKPNTLIREMHEHSEFLDNFSETRKENLEGLLEGLEKKIDLLARTPAIRPTEGWITSDFGYRKSPFTGLKEFHKGLDIAAGKGTPIIATADGVITFSGKKGGMGKTVIIDHGHGLITRYGHACKLLKKRGDSVKRGDTVALVGSSGRSTGSHVHYEVLLNGIPVNPQKYILN